MTPYLIIYSCKSSVKKFKAADAAIRECSWDQCWMYHLNNTWIIKSDMTADEIGTRLTNVTVTNDDFLVIEITNNYACWLPQQALDYLKDHIFSDVENEQNKN
ncbi:MAG: hypothetical protein A2Y23_05065 [Clostridiales bacterium GWB2_37_7]|nr:MAG: hypothetical protein A2Y23_05065 [Clostridiales bacterium GWB2_37_7]